MVRKLFVIPLLLGLLLANAAPGLAGPGNTGFKLTGTDAAYADFEHDDCSVFVGYVWAKKLQNFDTGEVHRPHSDLEVKLIGACGDYEGVVGTVGNSRAEIVKLESASVDGITVPMAAGIDAVVDLDWTATGSVFKERIREPYVHANHRTRFADVTGTVTITGIGSTDLVFGEGDLMLGSRVTHYNERNWTPTP